MVVGRRVVVRPETLVWAVVGGERKEDSSGEVDRGGAGGFPFQSRDSQWRRCGGGVGFVVWCGVGVVVGGRGWW